MIYKTVSEDERAMEGFRRIAPEELTGNTFDMIGNGWMLVTAALPGGEGDFNTMTASWGGLGVLWGRDVFYCFVRPQRYTHRFAQAADKITLSFFDEQYRAALRICGTLSGRDTDKVARAGLTPVRGDDGDTVAFAQARAVITGRKLYSTPLRADAFVDTGIICEHYPQGDFHTAYICAADGVFIR